MILTLPTNDTLQWSNNLKVKVSKVLFKGFLRVLLHSGVVAL